MMNIETTIRQAGLVPVVKFTSLDTVLPTTEALLHGGLTCIEVTYRTAVAGEAIRLIKTTYPEAVVGAGTVLTVEQAEDAVKNGADFLVSPGLNPETVRRAEQLSIPMIPGVATPSEIEKGLSMGLTFLKFFPAEANGGVSMLKALSAPYSSVKFMPTGGIGLHNLNDYLALPCVLGCGGSFMIDEHNPARTAKLSEEAFLKTLNLRLGHIGLNNDAPEEAERTAKLLTSVLGLSYDDRGGAIFAGDRFEILRSHGRGEHGHIQLLTASIERAEPYFNRMGYHFDESSKAVDENGYLTLAYFKEQMSGFALHLSKI